MSRFDRFRTEQIRKERQFFNEKNYFQHDTKSEHLACHRLSLVISFIQSNKGHLAGFLSCLHRSVRKRPEGQMMHFFINSYQIKLNQNNTFL